MISGARLRWPPLSAYDSLQAGLREVDRPLVGHLDEEQIRELLDVVEVADAVVAEGVTKAPELLDYVGHGGPFEYPDHVAAAGTWRTSGVPPSPREPCRRGRSA